MSDKIEKFLKKLTSKEREVILSLLASLQKSDFENLDIKKLAGLQNIWRIRKGDVRIIFEKSRNKVIIIKIEKRSDTTY